MPKYYPTDEQIVSWHSLFFGNEGASFLLIVLVRTIVMFIIVLTTMRLLGKRSITQLSVFELVVILTLGSAAGDPMLYNEVGLLDALIVFMVTILIYRLTTYLAAHFLPFTRLIKGVPVYLIQDGTFCADSFRHQSIAFDEFFAELRQQGVSQLGQVCHAVLETSGEISLFFFADDEVRYGLCVLPPTTNGQYEEIGKEDFYSFIAFAEGLRKVEGDHNGKACGSWAKVSNAGRVT